MEANRKAATEILTGMQSEGLDLRVMSFQGKCFIEDELIVYIWILTGVCLLFR